jgi:phytoene dehydrogenase-like protein
MHDADVVIVGAGLTGLRAALEVSRAGLSVLVVERSNAVGGRMQTSNFRGALLDHGFQVLLPAYPEFKTLPSLAPLQCKSFTAGARVRFDSTWYDVVDPRRHLGHFLRATRHPLGSISDLVRFGIYVQTCTSKSIALSDLTTAQMLDRWNLSERFEGGFLKPFLRGVLLDPMLSSNSALARFYLSPGSPR